MIKLKKLFTPARIGSLEIPNRVVMEPMTTRFEDENSCVTDRSINYFAARAVGGVGLIQTGAGAITRSDTLAAGRPDVMMGLWDDAFVPQLKKLTDAVHKYGGLIAAQIWHPGMMNRKNSVGPSPSPFKGFFPGDPDRAVRELSIVEIKEIVRMFADAAGRSKKAGFDGVAIHGAHQYLITEFLSPYINRRTDEYGGSIEKRARFACEIIAQIRIKVGPGFPVIIRIDGDNYVQGGATIEEVKRQAPLLVEAGVDALDVSAGSWEGELMHQMPYMYPHGAIVHLAATVKKVVKVPVITSGKIVDQVMAEGILEEGSADFIGLGRALLADPEWVNKARNGVPGDINKCIGCNIGCFYRLVNQSKSISCVVNPALGREAEFELSTVARPKKVLVIGGGLAGMKAAEIAARRGHHVSLWEAGNKLGGQWNIASQIEEKKHFNQVTAQLSSSLAKAGVKVSLDKEATGEMVKQFKPDVIVMATGAKPASLKVPGVDGNNVVQAVDVIQGRVKVGNRVVVIGGRYVGMEVALMLARQGKKVHLVTRSHLGRDTDISVRQTLRDGLYEKGVPITQDAQVMEINSNGIRARVNYDTRRLMFLPADTVILATGSIPQGLLLNELKGQAPEIYAAGDCIEPQSGVDATNEGATIGLKI